MESALLLIVLAGLFTITAAMLFVVFAARKKSVNAIIAVNKPLPEFECELEDGTRISSGDLAGDKAVLIFVRGSWCPFCTAQVKEVTGQYRQIEEFGGRLIIVTRKPLDITQRVAEQFGVAFEFWLDKDLRAAAALGLVDEEAIPERFQDDFGKQTILPTVLVTDRDRKIRYSYRSAKPSDRPDPARFLSVLRSLD